MSAGLDREQEKIADRFDTLFEREVSRVKRKHHEMSGSEAEQYVADAMAASLDTIIAEDLA